jgi:hypothetical protein
MQQLIHKAIVSNSGLTPLPAKGPLSTDAERVHMICRQRLQTLCFPEISKKASVETLA